MIWLSSVDMWWFDMVEWMSVGLVWLSTVRCSGLIWLSSVEMWWFDMVEWMPAWFHT